MSRKFENIFYMKKKKQTGSHTARRCRSLLWAFYSWVGQLVHWLALWKHGAFITGNLSLSWKTSSHHDGREREETVARTRKRKSTWGWVIHKSNDSIIKRRRKNKEIRSEEREAKQYLRRIQKDENELPFDRQTWHSFVVCLHYSPLAIASSAHNLQP